MGTIKKIAQWKDPVNDKVYVRLEQTVQYDVVLTEECISDGDPIALGLLEEEVAQEVRATASNWLYEHTRLHKNSTGGLYKSLLELPEQNLMEAVSPTVAPVTEKRFSGGKKKS